jgi:hypothetical protein
MRLTILVLTGCLLAAVTGCGEGSATMQAFYRQSTVAGRAAITPGLVAGIQNGTVDVSNAIDFAYTELDQGRDATALAGAILDAVQQTESKFNSGGEFELFWMRVGRLAFKSAEHAHAAGNLPLAQSLVFAGPKRWQHSSYWERYSDHDGLASVILAKSGRREEAIARLRSRPSLDGVAAEVLGMLEKGQ